MPLGFCWQCIKRGKIDPCRVSFTLGRLFKDYGIVHKLNNYLHKHEPVVDIVTDTICRQMKANLLLVL